MSHGLQFQSSYVLTRDLSNEGGAVPTSFVAAGGNFLTDKYHPRLDYGNVIFDRRHRALTTFLYQLPFGKGATYLGNSGRLMDLAVGGWQLGGVLVFQSGPFLTPAQASVDSANTNILNTVGQTRADVVPGVAAKAVGGLMNPAGPVFLNPGAFTLPPANAGRFGNASVGSVVGPGTDAVSLSLIKSIGLRNSYSFSLGRRRVMRLIIGIMMCRRCLWMIRGLGRLVGCRRRRVRVRGMWRLRGGLVFSGWCGGRSPGRKSWAFCFGVVGGWGVSFLTREFVVGLGRSSFWELPPALSSRAKPRDLLCAFLQQRPRRATTLNLSSRAKPRDLLCELSPSNDQRKPPLLICHPERSRGICCAPFSLHKFVQSSRIGYAEEPLLG